MAKKRRRRANGEGTIQSLPNGKWKAVVTISVNPRKTMTKTFRSHADAISWLNGRKSERDAGSTSSDMLFCEWITTWLADVAKHQASNTHKGYEDIAERFLVPALGGVRLAEIRPMTIRNLLTGLDPLYGNTRTLGVVYEVLKTCLGAAVKMELVHRNPASQVSKPKHQKKEILPFEIDEVRRILKASESHRLHGLFVVAFHLGLRSGELFGLHWGDVDFEKGTIRIERQAIAPRGKLEIKSPKTRAGRRTLETLPPVVLNALRDRQALAMKEGLAGSEIVFPGARGAYLHGNTFSRRHWKPLLRKCGIKERGLHHIRHTFASMALVGGDGVEPSPPHVVAQILGHSSPVVTMNVYAHLIEAAQSTAIERVARLFAG